MAEPFIWHDPVEAQQAMSYAANVAKADLAKQENLFRMAELGLRRQQQQETAELNRLITASQLQQRQIENQFRERQLTQQAELERDRNKTTLDAYKIQFSPDRVDPRVAYDIQLRQQEEQQEAGLARQLETTLADLDKKIATTSELEKAPKQLGRQVTMGDITRTAINPIWGMSQLDYSGQRNVRNYLQQQLQREPTDEEITKFTASAKAYRAGPDTDKFGALKQRRDALVAQLTQLGWTYDPATKKIIRPTSPVASTLTAPPTGFTAPPTASALSAPALTDPRIDAIKREAAAAIQAGANPAAVYQRAAELGVDLR